MKSARLLQATVVPGVAVCSTPTPQAQAASLRVLGYTTTVPSN